MSQADVAALSRLQTVPKLGAVTLHKLLAALTAADLTPAQAVGLPAAEFARRLGEPFAWVGAALAEQDSAQAAGWAEKLASDGWTILTYLDAEYPPSLKTVLGDKCPPVLYLNGNVGLLNAPGIAFSGSRTVSERGLSAAAALAKQAVTHGLSVVSGHAKGVDQTAHHAALESGGATVFVPSEGALRFRLRADFRPFTQTTPDSWLIVTQYAPMEGWHVGSAMGRNRTIIGLSRALFILEAGVDGGTWDAALEAERLGHPLYVLRDPDRASGNALILARGKAHPIDSRDGLPQFPDLTVAPPSGSDAPRQLSLF